MCARLAAIEAPTRWCCSGILFRRPIGRGWTTKPRVAAVRCPTLIVQGENDRLGPLDVFYNALHA